MNLDRIASNFKIFLFCKKVTHFSFFRYFRQNLPNSQPNLGVGEGVRRVGGLDGGGDGGLGGNVGLRSLEAKVGHFALGGSDVGGRLTASELVCEFEISFVSGAVIAEEELGQQEREVLLVGVFGVVAVVVVFTVIMHELGPPAVVVLDHLTALEDRLEKIKEKYKRKMTQKIPGCCP